jgi:putative transposase
MKDWQSQVHVKWDCKYHVLIMPKYRERTFFGKRQKEIGGILRDLCREKEIGLVERHGLPDHIYMLLSIPPKSAVACTCPLR